MAGPRADSGVATRRGSVFPSLRGLKPTENRTSRRGFDRYAVLVSFLLGAAVLWVLPVAAQEGYWDSRFWLPEFGVSTGTLIDSSGRVEFGGFHFGKVALGRAPLLIWRRAKRRGPGVSPGRIRGPATRTGPPRHYEPSLAVLALSLPLPLTAVPSDGRREQAGSREREQKAPRGVTRGNTQMGR